MEKLITGGGELSLPDERTRLTKFQADLAEIELGKSRGAIITQKQVERIWGNIITTTRQQLLGLPVRLAPELTATKSIPESKDLLENAIYDILSELEHSTLEDAGGELTLQEGDELLPSTTKVDRKPMGRPKQKTEPRKQRRTRKVENSEG